MCGKKLIVGFEVFWAETGFRPSLCPPMLHRHIHPHSSTLNSSICTRTLYKFTGSKCERTEKNNQIWYKSKRGSTPRGNRVRTLLIFRSATEETCPLRPENKRQRSYILKHWSKHLSYCSIGYDTTTQGFHNFVIIYTKCLLINDRQHEELKMKTEFPFCVNCSFKKYLL